MCTVSCVNLRYLFRLNKNQVTYLTSKAESSPLLQSNCIYTHRHLTMEFLVRLIQIHETFRKPELEALAKLANIDLDIIAYSKYVCLSYINLASLRFNTFMSDSISVLSNFRLSFPIEKKEKREQIRISLSS